MRFKNFVELKDLKENPILIKKTVIEKKTRRGVVQMQSEVPVWIKPRNEGNACLYKALGRVKKIVEEWTSLHPNSFPPIVIHLSCFGYNGSEDSEILQLANEIKSLYTNDGNVVFANLIFSLDTNVEPILFPSSLTEMGKSVFGEMYFLMSSQLPLSFNKSIEDYRINFECDTFHTAVVFQTSLDDVPKLLQSLIFARH